MMAESAASRNLRQTVSLIRRGLTDPRADALSTFHKLKHGEFRTATEVDDAYDAMSAAASAAGVPIPSRAEFAQQASDRDSVGLFTQFVQDAGYDLEYRELLLPETDDAQQAAAGAFAGQSFVAANQATGVALTTAEIRERLAIRESNATPEATLHLAPVTIRPYADLDPIVARRLRRMRDYVRQMIMI